MHNLWKYGVVTSLHVYSLYASMRQGPDVFLDLTQSLEGGQETGSKNQLETLALFDDRGVAEGSHWVGNPSSSRKDASENHNDEAYPPAPKRQKVDLNLTLMLPGLSGPLPRQRNSSSSNEPVNPIPAVFNEILENFTQVNSLVPLDNMRPKLHKPTQVLATDGKSVDVLNVHSQNNEIGLKTWSQKMLNNINQYTSPTQAIPETSGNFDWQVVSKFWAWVPIILGHLEVSIEDEIKKELNVNGVALRKCYLPYKSFGGKKIKEACWLVNVRIRLVNMSKLLWVANHQVLKNYGTLKTKEDYIEEQMTIQNWFLDFLTEGRKDTITSKHPKSYAHQQWCNSDEGRIYQMVKDSIGAEADMTAYIFYQKELQNNPLLVSKPQILSTQAVFHLIGYFYQSMRKDKWEEIFGDSNELLSQLEEFRTTEIGKSIQDLNKGFLRGNVQFMVIWKAFSPKELLHSIPEFLSLENIQFQNNFKPVFNQKSISEMHEFNIIHSFNLENILEIEWGWIARSQYNKNSAYDKLFQPISDQITHEIYIYLKSVSEKISEPKMIVELGNISEQQILKKLEEFFDMLWGLNGQIIEFFGGKFQGEDYLKEQKSVQIFFLSIFSQTRRQEEINLKERPGNMKSSENLILGKIVDLVLELFTLDQNEEKLEVYPTREASNTVILRQDDLILSQIVVYILGFYYKNINYEKYHNHFNQDTQFFGFLITRSTRMFRYNQSKLKIDGEHGYIPWENKNYVWVPIDFKNHETQGRLNVKKWVTQINKNQTS